MRLRPPTWPGAGAEQPGGSAIRPGHLDVHHVHHRPHYDHHTRHSHDSHPSQYNQLQYRDVHHVHHPGADHPVLYELLQ